MPQEWQAFLEEQVGFFRFLPEDLHSRFFLLLKTFVWEKYFIGAGGMEITDRVKVVISAAAVRMILHLDLSYYDRLTEIVVYPGHFQNPDRDGDFVTFGEAHEWGTVVLSWEAVCHGLAAPDDGRDTATHEFAHVLDRTSGSFNGMPVLRALASYEPWARVMSHHFNRLRRHRRPEARALDDYGTLNEAEFFAVATESFFETPELLSRHTPELYEVLQRFYGCDPLARRKPR